MVFPTLTTNTVKVSNRGAVDGCLEVRLHLSLVKGVNLFHFLVLICLCLPLFLRHWVRSRSVMTSCVVIVAWLIPSWGQSYSKALGLRGYRA